MTRTNGQTAATKGRAARSGIGTETVTEKYLEAVAGADVSKRLPSEVRGLLAKDFPLSKIDRNDREYFRLLAENIVLYMRERYPPEESIMQDDVGGVLLGDPTYQRNSLSQRKVNEVERDLLVMFSRTARGQEGWQQDKLSESIETRRVEDGREDNDESKTLMERVFQS